MNLYHENPEAGARHRERILEQLKDLLENEEKKAVEERVRNFKPDFSSILAYETSIEPYRTQFKELLGWPLTQPTPVDPPLLNMEFLAEDDLGKIYRIWIETLPGFETYGLFFLPPGTGPFALVISQHGGWGTPELCSGFFNSANYNDMTRRVLRRGIAVFAPQLLLWKEDSGPKIDRPVINERLVGLGSSIAALELWELQRSLDALSTLPDIDPQRIGMVGLSYGGFYTHFMAAIDPRIKAAYCSCMLYDQPIDVPGDAAWKNAVSTFGFAEVTGLICPRAFYLEAGETDDLVPAINAPPLAAQARKLYQKLGTPDHFAFKIHPYWHEVDQSEDGFDFLQKHLVAY